MNLHQADTETLNGRLQDLAEENRKPGGRSGDVIATDQLAVFGELLVVLAQQLDGAQQTIKRLTWGIFGLTVVLVLDALWRVVSHYSG